MRLNPDQLSPAAQKKYLEFALTPGTLERGLRDLVNIRVSQINGCAFCLDMHVKEATIHGERALRLHHVAIWRESQLFSARERAALRWAELLTRLGHDGVSDDDYENARTTFSEEELSDLTFAVVAINGWNRLNIAFPKTPGSLDALYGLGKAGLD
jgi:AhpD family alkylhydroperoxidase